MNAPTTWTSPEHRKSVLWVVTLAAIAIVFDGYDLVVYGTVLPTLLDDPSQLGELSPGTAGALGSYALIGMMIGAFIAGTFGDRVGRRRMMLMNIAWFSIGMGATALAPNVATFGVLRCLTGIGIGGLVATVGALVAEFAPTSKRNLFNAIVYSGVPFGGVLAAVLALLLADHIGWRGLFWVGALPLVTLLPLAWLKMPESPQWLVSRGRLDEASAIGTRTGIPVDLYPQPAGQATAQPDKVGFAALASRRFALPTLLLGTMSFAGLLLTYGLNTWLPQIMESAGFNAKGSLSFLLVLNGGAIVGGLIAARLADGRGPQRIVATSFCLATFALICLTLGFPLPVLLAAVAVAGTGTIGTQVLIYGYVSNFYPTSARAAGVAWCAGFGRLGGIVGPVIGGLLIGAGISSSAAFYIFAAIALAGAAATMLVPQDKPKAEVTANPVTEAPLAAAE
ncbi:aromatic acid/H+ symport family MFS transporter [Gordonia sp. Z-3]|jgi:AAHS family benzoate transporter-like MFS transporter|uniref:Aromatic acid/H+ symport family MFS transporter n=2 Tax=Gordonia TaxID=2053 RepID=A0A9X3D4Y1_9ACTN|nr:MULTISPECIES: aromatic acid/H+ symport family MFS transporter [Gordonia]MCF3938081.1 aromatic acid/H+ symport family MFS transporter [Gordonia tangerina]MCX2963697.1 aromatic acid/H+ symport family MFS transporter [Gordonia aquimaris]MED5802224.1 aromatic acid/H+ symport family MFS transporter [Gordonia sp. Z-3]